MISSPSLDAQATILLCARLGPREESAETDARPLTTRSYSQLAKWLVERSLRPGDLLRNSGRTQLAELPAHDFDRQNIERLLDRGTALAIMVERWLSRGIWVLSRADVAYPQRLKRYLQQTAPPLLFGIGSQDALNTGGIAVVGSRHAAEVDIEFARRIGSACATASIQVISGVAKGIDFEGMSGALVEGGRALGVLAEGMARSLVPSRARQEIVQGRLTLVSPFDPDLRWLSFNAMERNKLIYAFADAALVVSCSDEKSGTWAGAHEALKTERIPVFVNIKSPSKGNQQLLNAGAREFPDTAWSDISLLASMPGKHQPLFENNGHLNGNRPVTAEEMPVKIDAPKTDAYSCVLPLLATVLAEAKTEKEAAKALDVSLPQMRAWLNRGISEGFLQKLKKPVRFVVSSSSLFGK